MKKAILVVLTALLVLSGLTVATAKNDKDKGGDKEKKCNWSTKWEKNPETFRLEPGQKETFTLIVTNHEKEKSVKLEFGTDSQYVKFDPASVELAAKASANIKVTVTMPPNPNNAQKATFKYWIKPSDSDKKEYKLDVHYYKKTCIFTAKWETEPKITLLKPGETKTLVLLVTNPSKTDEVKINVVTEAKKIEFSATSFTIKPGETYKLTIKVTQPEKGDAWKTVWSFRLVAECGLKKEFTIIAYYPGICMFTTQWEKEPAVLEPGKEATYILKIKNLNPAESLDMTVSSDNPNLKLSATSFTIPAGEIYKLSITVKQPEKGDKTYVTWKIVFKTSCGTTKEFIFKTKYEQTKNDCKFEASFPPGQENKKMQRGKDGQVVIHVKNTSSKTLEFSVGTNLDFAKADPGTFTLDAGKLNVVKINIKVPEGYQKDWIELVIKVKAGCGTVKELKLKLAVTK